MLLQLHLGCGFEVALTWVQDIVCRHAPCHHLSNGSLHVPNRDHMGSCVSKTGVEGYHDLVEKDVTSMQACRTISPAHVSGVKQHG